MEVMDNIDYEGDHGDGLGVVPPPPLMVVNSAS
jgi:hypothetical protein